MTTEEALAAGIKIGEARERQRCVDIMRFEARGRSPLVRDCYLSTANILALGEPLPDPLPEED
jgi:hypothetical protein